MTNTTIFEAPDQVPAPPTDSVENQMVWMLAVMGTDDPYFEMTASILSFCVAGKMSPKQENAMTIQAKRLAAAYEKGILPCQVAE